MPQILTTAGLSSLGVPGWQDQLTLFPPGGTDYTHLFTAGTPGFSDLPTALHLKKCFENFDKNSADKIQSENYKGVTPPCLMPIRVNRQKQN